MKFSKETLAVLKNFSTINPGIYLREGNVIKTSSFGASIYAEATIPETIESEFTVTDLNGFLNIISLSGFDSDIKLQSNGLIIKGDRTTMSWDIAVPDSLIAYPKRDFELPDPSVSFDLSAEDYQQIQRVSRALAIDTLKITSSNGYVVIEGYNKSIDTQLNDVLYTLTLEDETTEEFTYIIDMKNIKMISDSYKVGLISIDETIMIVVFKGVDVDTKYLIGAEVGSENSF